MNASIGFATWFVVPVTGDTEGRTSGLSAQFLLGSSRARFVDSAATVKPPQGEQSPTNTKTADHVNLYLRTAQLFALVWKTVFISSKQ